MIIHTCSRSLKMNFWIYMKIQVQRTHNFISSVCEGTRRVSVCRLRLNSDLWLNSELGGHMPVRASLTWSLYSLHTLNPLSLFTDYFWGHLLDAWWHTGQQNRVSRNLFFFFFFFQILCIFVNVSQTVLYELVQSIAEIKGSDSHSQWASDCCNYRSH